MAAHTAAVRVQPRQPVRRGDAAGGVGTLVRAFGPLRLRHRQRRVLFGHLLPRGATAGLAAGGPCAGPRRLPQPRRFHEPFQAQQRARFALGLRGRRCRPAEAVSALPHPEGRSLLELAYEKARDAKLPCLLFFKAPGSNGASSAATDTDTDARQVAAFRSRVQRKILVVHSFTTPDELREQLRSSLAQLRSELDARAGKARPTQRRAIPKRRAPPK